MVPSDERARYASWWLDSQLSKIRDSGLSNYAKINMCITMPTDWMFVEHTNFHKNLTGERISFKEKTIEYIESRYPFVHILDIRNNSNVELDHVNLYEGFTLQHMYKRCKEKMIYCLFLHTKGMYSNSYNVSNWRETVEHYLITNWRECVKIIDRDDVDIVATKDIYCHVPGAHYYWSKSDHIANLLEPLDSSKYLDESQKEVWPGTPGYKYSFERWPMTNNARMHWIHETNCAHYNDYYFYDFPQTKGTL
jgi:hypothetical protein